ncbi:MAG: hypothetical protein ABIH67_04145 [Candidatus Uhrbacteria bacterium]
MVIAKTGFYTSLISYLVFLLAEYIKPGFVSNYMSVHWFLLATIVFAIWWGSQVKTAHDRASVQYIVSGLFGLVLAILVWQVGSELHEFRILSLILALTLPIVVLGVLRSSK